MVTGHFKTIVMLFGYFKIAGDDLKYLVTISMMLVAILKWAVTTPNWSPINLKRCKAFRAFKVAGDHFEVDGCHFKMVSRHFKMLPRF